MPSDGATFLDVATAPSDVLPELTASVDDGVPMRRACSSRFGSSLTSDYGRLDGYLVALVPPMTRGCNSDQDHLHLQVLMAGAVYDVAVDLQSTRPGVDPLVAMLRTEVGALSGWSEGWHPGVTFDYAQSGVRSAAFMAAPIGALVSQLEAELAQVNHVSVLGTGYGPAGMHLIHRNITGRDGAIVTRPLDASPRAYLFRFSNQSF